MWLSREALNLIGSRLGPDDVLRSQPKVAQMNSFLSARMQESARQTDCLHASSTGLGMSGGCPQDPFILRQSCILASLWVRIGMVRALVTEAKAFSPSENICPEWQRHPLQPEACPEGAHKKCLPFVLSVGSLQCTQRMRILPPAYASLSSAHAIHPGCPLIPSMANKQPSNFADDRKRCRQGTCTLPTLTPASRCSRAAVTS